MADLATFASLMAPGDEPGSLVELFAAGRPSWYRDALCVEYPSESFHPELGQSAAPAKAVCERCLVRHECLTYAVDDPALGGIWGGLSARERGRLRRARTRSNAA
jgi:WhiB family redox-sensing transcriptional regulator